MPTGGLLLLSLHACSPDATVLPAAPPPAAPPPLVIPAAPTGNKCIFQDEATIRAEDLLSAYLRDPSPDMLQALRAEASALVADHPGFTFGWHLLASTLRLAGDPAGATTVLERVDPSSAPIYRHFFDLPPEDLLVYLDFAAMDRCLRRRGDRLWDGPALDGAGAPFASTLSCGGVTLDGRRMPEDQRVFMRLDRTLAGGDATDRISSWSSTGSPATVEELAALLGIGPGTRVADVGAGLGYFTFPLAQIVGDQGRIWAIEIDPLYVGLLEDRKARTGAQNVEVVQNTGPTLGIPPASVDMVFACEVIGDVFNTGLVSEERRVDAFITPFFEDVHRALVPGGTLVIIFRFRDPDLGITQILTHATLAGLVTLGEMTRFDKDFTVIRFVRPATP